MRAIRKSAARPRPLGVARVSWPMFPKLTGRETRATSVGARKRFTCSANSEVTCAPGRRVHCTFMKSAGTRAFASFVSSITTGAIKGTPSAIRCVRSAASFHSNRKYPSRRSDVAADTTGTNSAHALICRRSFWSH